MTNYVKKIIFILLVSTILSLPTFTTADGLLPIDAVLVLDVSRSMITADPNRIANEAMNMFIEKLELGRDQVGLVVYAGLVTYSREMVLLCEESLACLQDTIYKLEYASWTDHSLGLLEAIQIMYDGHTENRQPIIIFLTDGNLNVNPYGARTTAQSEYDKAVAINLAQQNNFPIYSIGLNVDGRLDKRYIEIIANETGGLAFETAHAEDLAYILDTIFSIMVTIPPMVEEPPYMPYEMLPILPVTVDVTYEELSYIQQELAEEPIEHTIHNHLWPLTITLAVILALLAFIIFRKPKRVFTGRLVIKVVDNLTRQADLPIHRNLIEYGSKTTLQRLLGREINPMFNNVTLVPSPHAPSHLPQLMIKCRRKIKFTKDFMEQDAFAGLTLNAGTEVNISLEGEPKEVTLRYLM